jgi:hypothetical protein
MQQWWQSAVVYGVSWPEAIVFVPTDHSDVMFAAEILTFLAREETNTSS